MHRPHGEVECVSVWHWMTWPRIFSRAEAEADDCYNFHPPVIRALKFKGLFSFLTKSKVKKLIVTSECDPCSFSSALPSSNMSSFSAYNAKWRVCSERTGVPTDVIRGFPYWHTNIYTCGNIYWYIHTISWNWCFNTYTWDSCNRVSLETKIQYDFIHYK